VGQNEQITLFAKRPFSEAQRHCSFFEKPNKTPDFFHLQNFVPKVSLLVL
jgi:hypothetical protein